MQNDQTIKAINPTLPDPGKAMELILRSGTGEPLAKQRIYFKYLIGKDPAYMEDLLRKEYGTTGMGFTIGGQKVSVWFDDKGLTAGYGLTAFRNTFLQLDWKQIESRIRSMVERAEYISGPEAYITEELEFRRVSKILERFFTESTGKIPEAILQDPEGAIEPRKRLIALLSTKDGRDLISGELTKAEKILEPAETTNGMKTLAELLQEVRDLGAERIPLPEPGFLDNRSPDFLTRDEIEAALCHGTGDPGSKKRIADYFTGNHTDQEKGEFLAYEYGQWVENKILPGSGDSWISTCRNRMEIMKGDLFCPACKAELSWEEAAKRIDALLSKGRYLTREEAEIKRTESVRGKLFRYRAEERNAPKPFGREKERKREMAL